jgi:hypothetical protein
MIAEPRGREGENFSELRKAEAQLLRIFLLRLEASEGV